MIGEVFYDPYDPEYPPDIIIVAANYHNALSSSSYSIQQTASDTMFSVRLEKIKPLVEWDATRADCLLQVLLFIRKLYSEYQRALVENFDVAKVKFESELLKHNHVCLLFLALLL